MKRLLHATALLIVLAAPAVAGAEPVTDRYPSDEALRHYLLGRWLEASGDLAGASAEFSRALALDPGATSIQMEACLVATRLGEAEHALELARGVLAREPRNPRAMWLEGAALLSLTRPRDAVASLRASVRIDPSNAECWRTLAHAAEIMESVELQDTCFASLVGLDEDDAESWFQLATTRARLGRFAEADSALSRAVEANPMRPGALFLRAWIRERLGRNDEAAALYEHHLEVHPGDLATRRRLMGLLTQQGRFRDALAQAKQVTAARPDDPSAYQGQAELEFRDRQPEQGMRTLARMRQLAPGDPSAVGRTVEVLVRVDRGKDAVRIADEWAREHPRDAHGLMLRAWAREAAGQLDSALAMARLAAASQPDSVAPLRQVARYLRLTRRWSEAIAEIDRLRRANPGDPGLLLDLGFCREQSGDLPGAIAAGRDALRLAPDSPATLNFLGYLLTDHDGDLAEAEGLIRRAVQQDPDNGAYVDSMGWLLFRRGELDEARAQLERALTLTGGDPVVHEHLGDLYRELRLFDLAKQQYRQSLARDAGNVRVRSKLEDVR